MAEPRPPAVAGTFYPRDPSALRAEVERLLADVASDGAAPKAIVSPHAGYRYSGPIAAQAWARLRSGRGVVRRVVLLGPAHRVCVRGVATSTASAFRTPLGDVRVCREAVAAIEELPFVRAFDDAHRDEHSLEVQLPFLQVVLGEDVEIVPLAVGDATTDEVASAIEALFGGDETLVVVSSDLSHYLDDAAARELDAETCRAIEELRPDRIGEEQACGRVPLRGLLATASRRGLAVETLDLRNSGDTSGKRDWVVGYGAWAFGAT